MESTKNRWEFTKEFVGKELVGEPVTEVKIGKGLNVGDNVSGDLVSFSATTSKGQVIHLVFKTFPDDPEQLNYVVVNRVFRIETSVYRVVVPALQKLLAQNGLPTDLPIPKFVAAHNDDVNDYLCLEDVRPAGFKMVDKFIGLDQMETALVLKELARFHALTYFLIRYEGEKFFEGAGEIENLRSNLWTKDAVNWEVASKFFGGSTTVGLEFLTEQDPPLARKVRHALGDLENAGKILKSTTMKTDTKYFPCIVHGDLWTNNVLFKYVDGKPNEVIFVDFQQARRGNIYEDLQYFFLTSTSPDDRRKFLSQWLETYYLSFSKTLETVNCPLPTNFTRGFFVEEMWNCFLSGYVYMHFAIPFQLGIFTPADGEIDEPLPEPTEGDSHIETISAKLHAKFRKWMKRSPAAKKRLLEISQEFVEYGLI